MNAFSSRQVKAIVCFLAGGAIGGSIHFLITKMIQPEAIWYFPLGEYWISPTYKNFLLANILGLLFFYLSCFIAVKKGWVIFVKAVSGIKQFLMMCGMIAVNSILFYLSLDMRFVPASWLLFLVGFSLSLSLIMRVYSGRWSIAGSILFFIGSFLVPNIASIPGVENSIAYTYPLLLLFLPGVCGYWLSIYRAAQGQALR